MYLLIPRGAGRAEAIGRARGLETVKAGAILPFPRPLESGGTGYGVACLPAESETKLPERLSRSPILMAFN